MDGDDVTKAVVNEAVKAAAEVSKGGLRALLARVRAWWRGEGKDPTAPITPGPDPSSEPGVLILGPGGTGKTTLARLLSGGGDLLDPPQTYEGSVGQEKYSLSDAPRAEIVVPPGQKHRRGQAWDDLLAAAAAGDYRGIVLATAYGHQSIARSSYKQHTAFTEGMGKEEFLAKLLDDQRADELAVLDRVVPLLRVVPHRVWVLTVVTKQDVWWPIRDEVERYYREGEYHGRISAAARPEVRHEVCTVSLTIQNWTTRAGERFRPNAEGYDRVLQVDSVRRLLETIDALRNWEAGE